MVIHSTQKTLMVFAVLCPTANVLQRLFIIKRNYYHKHLPVNGHFLFKMRKFFPSNVLPYSHIRITVIIYYIIVITLWT